MSVGQPTEEPSDARIKHLEFVQAVIARQASNSFLLKGWALTVAAAFFGFVATQLHWEVALVALLPVIVFWFLDAYYLRQERLFRCLFEEARQPGSSVPLFSMDTRPYKSNESAGWLNVAKSVTLSPFYGLLLVVGLLLLGISIHHDANSAHAARTRSEMSSVACSVHGSGGGQMLPM
jgi:hypothetical protein